METRMFDYSVKHSNSKFKKKGDRKKGSTRYPSHRHSSYDSWNGYGEETSYRILCPSGKIGGVIGRGGGIINSLREETKAKIAVSDSIPGCDERVILIYSSTEKVSKEFNTNEGSGSENGDESMKPYCTAQDALLKIFDRITDEDRFGGMKFDDENESLNTTARLLIQGHMVGCIIGKQGDVIEKLRSQTGANIRVLPAYDIPACALNTDELVLISGQSDIVKQALYKISTLLHQHPRKEKLPPGLPGFRGSSQYFVPRGDVPPDNMLWPQRNSMHNFPASPWLREHNLPHDLDSRDNKVAKSEFSIKMLCPARKIGSVIGKGGSNVRQLERETGTNIHVEDPLPDVEERVIEITSPETLLNLRSKVIDAALLLQHRIDEHFEKGVNTTRILVPSAKIGCIIGEGGQIITEMRRRIEADIRVLPKEEKPKCASALDELVQISGSYRVTRDALAEIASRLRTRCLRQRPEAASHMPLHGYTPDGTSPSLAMGVGGYPHEICFPSQGGEREYAAHSYTGPPSSYEYTNPNATAIEKVPRVPELSSVRYPLTHGFVNPDGTSLHQGVTNPPQAAYPDRNATSMQGMNPNLTAQQLTSFYPHAHASQPLPIYPHTPSSRPVSVYPHATPLQPVGGDAAQVNTFQSMGSSQISYF